MKIKLALLLLIISNISIYSSEFLLNHENWEVYNGENWEKTNIESFENSNSVLLKNDFYLEDIDFSYLNIPDLLMFDKTTINNVEIGQLHPGEFSNFMGGREYFIPPSVLKVGKNSLVIQLSWIDELNGSLSKDISLLSKEEYKKKHIINNLTWNILPLVFIGIFLITSVSLFVKYLFNRGCKHYFLMSLRLVIITLSFISVSSPVKLFNISNIVTVWYIIIILLFINITLYYQSLIKRYYNRYNIILSLLLFLSLINSIALLSILTATLVFNLKNLNSLEKKGDASIVYIHSLIDLTGVFLSVLTIIIYTIIPNFDAGSIMMFLSLIISVNYVLMHIRLDTLNKKKYESIQEKATSNKGEERVLEVIKYINNNIQSPLYRDDLAASIGYTSSYFSTIFNSITGKTFSAYLNELRITKAIELMRDPELKISYIAFEVGFESLSTFNRVFKSIHEVPPSKFRKLSLC